MVADGARGTMLYGKGVFINRCYDELNLSQPALVREIHAEYVKAGAEILETNTYGRPGFAWPASACPTSFRQSTALESGWPGKRPRMPPSWQAPSDR
jgi:S-methylmethionine-dependent homocysteine/selenocysteine methylase